MAECWRIVVYQFGEGEKARPTRVLHPGTKAPVYYVDEEVREFIAGLPGKEGEDTHAPRPAAHAPLGLSLRPIANPGDPERNGLGRDHTTPRPGPRGSFMSESQLMDPRDVQQLERLETVSKRLELLFPGTSARSLFAELKKLPR